MQSPFRAPRRHHRGCVREDENSGAVYGTVADVDAPKRAEAERSDLLRRLAAEVPGVGAIAFTMDEDRADVHQQLDAGAKGYLLEGSAAEDLLRAVRAAAKSRLHLDPTLAGASVADQMARAASRVTRPRTDQTPHVRRPATAPR